MTPYRAISAALLLVALAMPGIASACAVCMGGQTDETRYAFLWTTGFLSALPLCLVGGMVWWLRRRARNLAARDTAAPSAALVAGSGRRTS